jgi:phosphonate transport system substrate-binding protein
MKIRSIFKAAASFILAGVTAFSLFACSSSSTEASPSPSADTTATASAPVATNNSTKYPDTITVVWYPNESASDYEAARKKFYSYIEQATGKKVEEKLTTDYSIAIEAIASGTAQICFMGAQGYIQAKSMSDAVNPLVVNSGASGTLDDAIYYSWMCVNKDDADGYMKDGAYSIDKIQGKAFSFVSNSSTSGFKVPTAAIINYFNTMDQWKALDQDALIEGGTDRFFSEVLFGGSHQGSAVNLLTGKADIAAYCDTELAIYTSLVSGDANMVGSVYEVKADATAPFDTLTGKQFVLINSIPVLNGPFVYNAETLSPEDVKAIQELLTSDTVTNDQEIFVPKGSEFKGMLKKTDKEHFVLVEDSWYNPIRELAS